MRIISGKLKRHQFFPPKGFPSRPTTDFSKEGLFNILENDLVMTDLEILDLFAGTGNISFEFASREAGKITAVDKNFKCVTFIRKFAMENQLDNDIITLKADVLKFLDNQMKSYDLIFADPPFDEVIHKEVVDKVLAGNILNEDGLFIIEHGRNNSFEEHPKFFKSRNYGGVIFSFFRHNS
ncbi:MAG TPA: RsmD family RNA methyltransferase [Brumimicrobium sp.]|nr:RsmD family RNA methyltransferase [Brumimicrobium sp.]